jgi:galactonate dehydratase
LQVVNAGYTAVKVVFVPFAEPLTDAPTVKKFGAVMGMLREAAGDRIDIMVDFHGRTWPAVAVEYINAIAEYRPYFVEEPVPPENIDALAQVRRAVSVPIATGERLVTRHQFREVFEKQAAHVIQPDLCHCGGLWEAKKIAAAAETYYVGVAPHNPLGPIANAAALHFALSTPNFLIQEEKTCSATYPGDGTLWRARCEPRTATGCPATLRDSESRSTRRLPQRTRSSRKSWLRWFIRRTARCSTGNHTNLYRVLVE